MKKKITVLVFLILAVCSTINAGDGMQHFYTQYKTDKHVESARIPKFLIAFLRKDPETRALFHCLKSVRIFHMKELNNRRRQIVKELNDALVKDDFESLLQVTESEQRIHIYINQDKKRLRKVLIMFYDDEGLVLLQAKTRIPINRFHSIANDYLSGKDNAGLKKVLGRKG